MILFFCIGCIEWREENLEALFQSARLLQLNPVVEACCQFLIRELDPGNCLGIKMFADTQGCSDLSEGARRYALENFMEVMNNQEYLTLPRQEVARLLESDVLNVPSEETVFHVRIFCNGHLSLSCFRTYDGIERC